jgi:MFS family permease
MKTFAAAIKGHTGVGYRHYVLAAMTGVTTLNYLDRVLMALVLQPIKSDLKLSDTQLGFLTGIAFALFYATLGIPISRWADRGNRVTITSLAIGLWGLTVMSCLYVTNFTQLLLARVAAAVGESGCVPPTYSLVGDYFPKAGERARALAIYIASNPLAYLIGFILGGWLNEHYGWRMSFFIVGLPGLLMAVVVKLTVSEFPQRVSPTHASSIEVPRLLDVLKHLWCQRSSRQLIIGFILFMTLGLGLTPWYAAFLIRSHGMTTAQIGIWFGLIVGIGGAVGMVFGGYVAGRWWADDESKQLRLTALMSVVLVPCLALFLLIPQRSLALMALVPMVLVLNCFSGPMYALMQRLVPPNMRATTLSVALLLANLIGLGLGPQIVGIVSDALKESSGADSLRYAMLAIAPVAAWAAVHFYLASRSITQDLKVVASGLPDAFSGPLAPHS